MVQPIGGPKMDGAVFGDQPEGSQKAGKPEDPAAAANPAGAAEAQKRFGGGGDGV